VETLFEIGGALAGLQVAWAYATGAKGLTVDQAAALVVATVMSARALTQAVRRYWQRHHWGLAHMEVPPDRWVIFLSRIISNHLTLPHS